MPPPPIRGRREPKPIDFDSLKKAIETAKVVLQYLTVGVPIVRRGPRGEVHVDVPVMYVDFAVDRVHYDPQLEAPSPKGRPVAAFAEVDPQEVRSKLEEVLKESVVLEAAEFRDPEDAWVIPVAWRNLIILHIKVSRDGEEIVPDYGLTEEVRRHV